MARFDVIVVGAPLYNFSVPSQLKSWIDRIAQAGRTFTYTETGPKGLAGGKTVIVASTRGGVYSTSDWGRAAEHQESYLQTVFGFLGITDVRFVRAEGVAMGDVVRQQALAAELLKDPDVDSLSSFIGVDGTNTTLNSWSGSSATKALMVEPLLTAKLAG